MAAATQTIRILVSSLILAFVFYQSFAEDLLHQTCRKTDYNDLCLSTLQSAHPNSTADLDVFANIFINSAISTSSNLISYIHKLESSYTNDNKTLGTLRSCGYSFNIATNVLEDARLFLATKHYDGVYKKVGLAKDQVSSCRTLLTSSPPGNQSLVSPKIEVFHRLCSIEQSIVTLIH